jgi:hypothetical protein
MQQQEDLDDNPRGIDQQFEKAKQQCKEDPITTSKESSKT